MYLIYFKIKIFYMMIIYWFKLKKPKIYLSWVKKSKDYTTDESLREQNCIFFSY